MPSSKRRLEEHSDIRDLSTPMRRLPPLKRGYTMIAFTKITELRTI